MSSRFLPILMRHGAHHYYGHSGRIARGLPNRRRGNEFSARPAASDLILLLESDEWSEEAGIPAFEVKPLFTEPPLQMRESERDRLR